MIQVDRDRVPMPSILGPDPESWGNRELREAEEFYAIPEERRRQKRFQFEACFDNSVYETLIELFKGKCAYCESRISESNPGVVEHFRPYNGVIVENGDYYPDLYWWLANEWRNLLLSCFNCIETYSPEGRPIGYAQSEGGKAFFPLESEENRAKIPGDEKYEHPLLLNPCEDNPQEHLVFTEDGLVVSETLRGRKTITVLNLNRPGLVETRRNVAQVILEKIEHVKSLFEELSNYPEDIVLREDIREYLFELEDMASSDQEYAGLIRQLTGSVLNRFWKKIYKLDESTYSRDELALRISKKKRMEARKSYQAYQIDQAGYSLKDEYGLEKYRLNRPLIEWVELKNIKAIKELRLDLISSQGNLKQWLMLLGENATGKSTVLQAIALVLIGPEYFIDLINIENIKLSEYIRDRTKSGHVKVHLTGFPKPHRLIIRDTHVEFQNPFGEISRIFYEDNQIEGYGWVPQTLVLGYGATRLLPKQETMGYGGDFGRIDNLFSPFVPLMDAGRWLSGLDEITFDYTARAMKDLLGLEENDELIRRDNRVWLKEPSVTLPLENLCDGYQSVIALTADILEIVLRIWPTPEEANGVVLLDEIGSHLHPTWKMRIVSSLRKIFPRIQFIATTHQPLCLRGLSNEEVVVMRKDKERGIWAITDLPPISGLRVDQLLTSEYFGLNSTLDPEIESKFNKYYRLLSRVDLSDDEKVELEEMKKDLTKLDLMGETRRQRLMLEAIDLALARKEEIDLEEISRIEDETSKTMKNIWTKLKEKERS